ncbi:hypothetical protein [Bacillus solimangrovi]|nr:hypothetical protein [Bacillus solimangrovi]
MFKMICFVTISLLHEYWLYHHLPTVHYYQICNNIMKKNSMKKRH